MDPVRLRQALGQNIVVYCIECGREIEQTQQSVVTRVNRLYEISPLLQESGLSRAIPPVGRLMNWQEARRRQVPDEVDANDALDNDRFEIGWYSWNAHKRGSVSFFRRGVAYGM